MGRRLLISLKALEPGNSNNISKHSVQAFIYSSLIGTDFEDYHQRRGFKFFTFSDFWPSGKFSEGDRLHFLFSSPIDGLVRALEEGITSEGKIGPYWFEISSRRVRQRLKVCWVTGSPVVLYLDSKRNLYLTPERRDLWFYFKRLEENSKKKYKAFYGEDPEIYGPLFQGVIYWKPVRTIIKKGDKEFLVIGTKWKVLMREYIEASEKKFYEFLYYCGLGEKNSLGFGLVNEISKRV